MSQNGAHATVVANDVPVVDSFQFSNPFLTPSTVSLKLQWDATSAPVEVGSGNVVPPTDPAAFLGTFAAARATGRLSGAELGFSFVSGPGASSDLGYAELGRERNGAFLS